MKNQKDGLGDRMKGYENVERKHLMRRQPCIIRLDGKAFHSFTRGFQKPFDMVLMNSMWDTTKYLCQNIQGCKIAYTQSDEITLLLTDYDELETSAWFDKNIQKMISISASMATLAFNKAFRSRAEEYFQDQRIVFFKKYRDELEKEFNKFTKGEIDSYPEIYNHSLFRKENALAFLYRNKIDTALFDSRVFNLPKEEVCNCFIWRQQDATRNAIQMVGQANFSHKQLQNKNCNEIQEMLWQEKDINFNDFPVFQKRGVCIIKETYNKDDTQRNRWCPDFEIPIFTKDRDYINKYI